MTHGEQFSDRVNDTDFMSTGFQQTRHDGDGELFAAADQRGIDADRALTQQADAVQNMLNLSKFLLHEGFLTGQSGKAGLGVGKGPEGSAKMRSASAILGEGILAANGLFNHRYQCG
ncbi:hypothetical protein LNP74_00315 [Klebsiella pneumoniae subsp. pneumoniae]|nr:hypothetical protein [Klebsiella pneumoniae subsp. pneumoniae]